MRHKGLLIGTIALVTLVILITYVIAFQAEQPRKRLDNRPMMVKIAPVVQRMLTDYLEAVATARAYESVTISANVTEYIRTLHFEDGDQVKKGDLLVELETAEEKTRLQEAQARLHEAKLQFQRIKNLLKRNFSAQSEYDAQKANVESAEARVAQIKATIGDRIIVAPFAGVLGFRLVSEGTLIEPGDDIVTLDMIEQLRVDFSVPEKFLNSLHEGQAFTATSIAYPNQTFRGTIATIQSRVDEQTRSITLRGIINNPELKLKPGMLLHVRLPIGQKKVWTVPEEALLAQEDKRYVFVVVPKTMKAFRREVHLVSRSGSEVNIEASLNDNELVVVAGGFKLQNGQEVRVKHVAQ